MSRHHYYRRYRRYHRHHHSHTLHQAGRMASKIGWGTAKAAWRIADRIALTGMKLGFAAIRGMVSLGRR